MPQQLEAMHEDDPFLEHLESLKEHPGWLAYQSWIERELASTLAKIEREDTTIDIYISFRGKAAAYRLAQKGLEMLISEHRDKLKEVRK